MRSAFLFQKSSLESEVAPAIPNACSYVIYVISPECIVPSFSPLIFNCFDGSSKTTHFLYKEIYRIMFCSGLLYWDFPTSVLREESFL